MGIGDPQKKRIVELDGVRGAAIALVLAWHYLALQIHAEPGSFVAYAMLPLRLSWRGVDLFFVLSGFLIGGILIDSKDRPGAAQTFWTRRACRILPLYILTLSLFFIALLLGLKPSAPWLLADPMPALSYATFTQNFAMAANDTFGANWMGVSWSLALEEQFYLVLALMLLGLPRHFTLCLIAALIGAAPLARSFVAGGAAAHVLPFCRSEPILLGVLLAFLVRDQIWDVRKSFITIVAVAVLVGGLACFAAAIRMQAQWRVLYEPLALFYASLVLLSLRFAGTPATSLLRLPLLDWFGNRSFGIFLMHQPVSGILHQAILSREPMIDDPTSALVTLVALLTTLALAEASFRWLESPFLAWGRRQQFSSPVVRHRQS
jgi:peptidoglycan/LPS O-acetylase OafA/YrhL